MNTATTPPARWRWVVLAVGLGAMTAGCAAQFGLPFLIPALRAEGLSLGQASIVVACPMAGLLGTLFAWGLLADRHGERLVLVLGLLIAGLAQCAAAFVHGLVPLAICIVVAGAGGASVHAASGRLILGWFSARERGLAMGIRQTAQPLGVALAAATLPGLAAFGLGAPLLALGGFCVSMAVLAALLARDPARTARAAVRDRSPYRTPVLWRLHATSALLVVPQFAVATFSLVYLVDACGWAPDTAGRVLALTQVGGALTRLAAGIWSDRVGSRVRPLRLVAAAITVVMLALAAGAYAGSGAAIVPLLIAGVITVSPNGLAFTAVAEYAGGAWAGRALGLQNTVQNAFALATAPVLGIVVGGPGYGAAFASVLVFPLVATLMVPMISTEPGGGVAGQQVTGRGGAGQEELAPGR
ncbi:MFS transporter [Actinomadura scrupuli]|uniref:MFS transporter n=1 Tax=Actinomadura scrupuli TaxID=559629 RepID=UPI003D9677DF